MKKEKRDSPRELRLKIDKHGLDEECTNLPDDYQYWGEQLAAAKNRVAKAKAELELTEAELSLAVRQNPGQYGFSGKPTESAVAGRVLTRPEYQTALSEYNAARHEVDQLEVAVRGLDHKRSLIQELCGLHNASYFARVVTRPKGMKQGVKGRDG